LLSASSSLLFIDSNSNQGNPCCRNFASTKRLSGFLPPGGNARIAPNSHQLKIWYTAQQVIPQNKPKRAMQH
jgi:hypothetical protein